MTDEGWRTLTHLSPLLGYAYHRAIARQRGLFGCACCRLAHDWTLPDPEADALDATERYLDGAISRRTWQRRRAPLTAKDPGWARGATDWDRDFRACVARLFSDGTAVYTSYDLIRAVERVSSPEYAEAFESKLCAALRDIAGNPFRPVPFDPAWRTGTAVTMAKEMYESRDFGAMPILADALQDAGCDSDEVLAHCRDLHAVHVRGCWVADRLLGRE